MRPLAVAAVLAATAFAAAGCGGASDSAGTATAAGGATTAKLALVANSTPQVAYDEAIPAFQKTAAGKGVGFSESFGASGDQSRAVAAGQPADVVEFSLAPDLQRLVKAGLVAPGWDATATHGFVTESVVVFVVRQGNPKGIHTWQDLLKPGVKVLTPNPFSSGSAKWNLMAAYGAQVKAGRSPAQALAYLKELIGRHVSVQDKSGRDALADFTSGNGDVLLSYENEAITAQQKGQAVDYVVPDDTILIQNPIAVVKSSKHQAQAQAFVRYLLSPAGQRIFAKHGYRPVDPAIAKEFASRFPVPKGLFTIGDLGGWTQIDKRFFDPVSGSVAKIEAQAGVSASK
ncbi:MAG TPA: sulfate ABC transporter substrate-binding protein [Solirubrobacteraceae bacterium]|nr:sulfate ABC transporter substrate-binding protein [Solirubrobacteraceae bacterium]